MLDAVTAHAAHALSGLKAVEATSPDDRIHTLLAHYGLRVKDVTATSALLYGADACIDPMARIIRIRRDIDQRYRREIIAHELAHVVLGHHLLGGEPHRKNALAAYGRNERIERMADNLAANILITDQDIDRVRKTCDTFSKAASMLDVSSKTLIRRLTQNQSPVNDLPMRSVSLHEFQVDAVECDGNVCIDGGVGTGKTEVLLQRLIRFANRTDTGHSRILFVTYLRRHMVYLFERLTKMAPLLAERVNFTTFHDYAADIILRNAEVAGYSSTPTVIGQGELLVLLQKMFPNASQSDLQRKCDGFTQSLVGDSSPPDSWQQELSAHLLRLNYIHNGSLGKIASKLMTTQAVSLDESNRWDAIFVDNYEQLTFEELSVLRLAASRAPMGLSAASGYSALPYVYRGIQVDRFETWKQECQFMRFDFSQRSRIRTIPLENRLTPENPEACLIQTIQQITNQFPVEDKIIVASHHNAMLTKCRALLVGSLPEHFADALGNHEHSDKLYRLVDEQGDLQTFLDAWWSYYRTCTSSHIKNLQEVLANVQMFVSHRERSQTVGLPTVTMQQYMESIRPHHQYKDIQIVERLSFQTLHALSGGEVEHLVILLDDLSDCLFENENVNPSAVALLTNAGARATKSLTFVNASLS